jgi:cellulose synthase/poly-beta-1,6-N-acetylglucosamine synthase-like glycosyltransferase
MAIDERPVPASPAESDRSAPTVSVVIPAFNEHDTIRACVIAVLDQTVPAFEIIVVDNASTDDTAGIVRELQSAYPAAPIIYLLQDALQGITPTRNAGFDRAAGEIIGRIDSDSVVEPNWVEEVQKAFANPDVAAATGPAIYYDMPLRRFGARADDLLRRTQVTIANDYHLLFGSNMAIRATAWAAVGPHTCADLDDLGHEDIDLSIHLHEAGLTVIYWSAMVAGMSARRLDDSPLEFFDYVMRFERTYQKHNIRSISLRAPMAVFLGAYPALKAMRKAELRRVADESAGKSK